MVAAHVWLQSFDNGGDDMNDTLPVSETELGCSAEPCCEELPPATDRKEAAASADGKGETEAVVSNISVDAPNEPPPAEISAEECAAVSTTSDEKGSVNLGQFSTLLSPIGAGITEAMRRFERLESAFETKLACDAHQQSIIDRLHAELQTHKDGLVLNLLQPMALDLISAVDDVGKTIDRQFSAPESATSTNLLNCLVGLREELEIILERYGFVGSVSEGDEFNPQFQRIARRVDTPDASLDRKIERRIGKGYSYEGRPIRPELVALYRVVTVASTPPDTMPP